MKYGLRVTPENGGLNDMYEATRAAGFGKETLDAYNENLRGLGGKVVISVPKSSASVSEDPLGIR